MKDYTEYPEFAGPQSEGTLFGQDYGTPGMPTIGQAPHLLSPEQTARERADAERRYLIRQAAERAALAAGQSALEAAATADRLIREAHEAAAKATS